MRRKLFGIRTLVLAIAIVAIGAWNVPTAFGQGFNFSSDPLPGGSLDPTTIPKFEDQLVIPPVMPPVSPGGSYYRVGMRQFEQRVLPKTMNMWTLVWGYGPADDKNSKNFHSPAFTFETKVDEIVQVDWINQLVTEENKFLPHLLPVDPTLHWANPAGGEDGKDMRTMMFKKTPSPYLGPIPTVPHLHGAHVADHSDGYPEAWYLPAAKNIPKGYATKGTHYTSQTAGDVGGPNPGKALYEYTNDQRPTTLWYHDHTLGMTRTNVYAGLAGFWLIRDELQESDLNLPGPAPQDATLWEPQTASEAPPFREIPIVIQDRSFNKDGSLFYPDTREFFDGYAGPYVPDTEIPPIWNPEFFGNTMMVNGKTWPYLNVEPKKYRFRLLNGCNSRFVVLQLEAVGVSGDPTVTIHQIGNDGGLLPGTPIDVEQLLMGPAERADVIVDFSSFAPGTEIVMYNYGPDEPFGGLPEDPSDPAAEYFASNAETTGQVMKFKVVEGSGVDTSSVPTELPSITPLPDYTMVRDLTLNEHAHMPTPTDPDPLFDGPVAAMLGTAADGPLMWMSEITETPTMGDTEVWRVINLTEDAHPIHLHLVQFEILGRTAFDHDAFAADQAAYIEGGKQGTAPDPSDYVTGPERAPEPGEAGAKDTVIVYPGEFTTLKATFDMAGLYVWHCHILEHEDNEMMRPYRVLPQ